MSVVALDEVSLESLKLDFEKRLSFLKDLLQLEDLRVEFLGRKGHVFSLMSYLKAATQGEKRLFGPKINALKAFFTEKIAAKKVELQAQELESRLQGQNQFDVTAYNPLKGPSGNLHFYTKFLQEIEDVFISMGFEVFDGFEVESEFFNFTALNIPEDHPAKDMYDTLWLDQPGQLLRTHTSSVQVRELLARKSFPLAGIAPGRVFRHEATDATHEVVFTQCEGLFVDKEVSLAHLLGVAKTFLRRFFKVEHLEIRVRPGFFPFVEPGVEIDMKCVFCKSGCAICKKTTWIEVFPGGIVHRKVFEFCNLDPEVYSGFAFGFGVERLAMLRHGIRDIRHFKSGDIDFLNQF